MGRVDFVLARVAFAVSPGTFGPSFLVIPVVRDAESTRPARPARSILASRPKTSQLVPSRRFRTIFSRASLPGSFDH